MWKLLGWVVTGLTIAVLGGISVVFWLFYHYGKGLPDCDQLAQYNPPVVSRLYSGDGHLFAEYAAQKRVFIPVAAIPPHIIRTFLAAEDKNFYQHAGLDFTGIARALWTNLLNRSTQKRPVGGSTITQQVAKNFLLGSNEVSFERKIKEAILAFRIEKTFSKEKILELYLNEIYLGHGFYGVAAAALNYFNKSLEELTIQEAAFLAGLPKAPSRYDPVRMPDLARSRRDWVIGRMIEDKVISPEEGVIAKEKQIVLQKREPDQVVNADYFAEEVRRRLVELYGEKALYEEGLTIKTTLTPQLQKFAEQALHQGLITYDRRHGWRGPVTRMTITQLHKWVEVLEELPLPAGTNSWQLAVVLAVDKDHVDIGLTSKKQGKIPLEALKWARIALKEGKVGPAVTKPADILVRGDVILVAPEANHPDFYTLEQIPEVNGAIIVMDPLTGRVLALVGGYSFQASQFDRATQAMRQPGSVFKTFVFLAALEKGLSPTTLINDAPISIPLGPGLGLYEPNNITKQFYGPTTLRVGLEKSRNIVTVRLAAEHVGMRRIARITEKFGVMKKMPLQLSMALGAGETTLLSLTTAYAMLANGGKRIIPTLIDVIHDRQGHILLRTDGRQCKECLSAFKDQPHPPEIVDEREQVCDPVVLYQLVSILEGVIQRGTAQSLKTLNQLIAGKTGTSNDFRDAWFIGIHPKMAVGIWVGFDNFRTLGDKEGGSRVAAPICLSFMKEALKNSLPCPFPIPKGVRLARVHPATGKPATAQDKNAIFEAFRSDKPEVILSKTQEFKVSTPLAEVETSVTISPPPPPLVASPPPLNTLEGAVPPPVTIIPSSPLPEEIRVENAPPVTGTGGVY